MTTQDDDRDGDRTSLDGRIERAIRRARRVALWEIAWREAVVPAWLVGLAVGLAWIGVGGLPHGLGRTIEIGLFCLAAVAAVRALVRVGSRRAVASDRSAALARIEAASGLRARELRGYEDRLAEATEDVATRALWAAHRARLAGRLGHLAVGPARPDLPRRDRFALRPALGLLLFVGWFAADGEHAARFAAAFAVAAEETTADRLDVWIDPPAFTGLAPIVPPTAGAATAPIEVVAGSRLVARVATADAATPAKPPQVRADPAEAVVEDASQTAGESRRSIRGSATIAVEHGGETVRFAVVAKPDRPPTIRLVEAPSVRGRGLRLVYETADDWGVTAATAETAPVAAQDTRPLYEGPSLPLTLPTGARHVGRAETSRDLTAHPLAGTVVRLKLTVRDGAGLEGRTEPIVVRLPERPFREPLARALAELRRRLAADADEIGPVAIGLQALTLEPEHFQERAGIHLGLRHLATTAARARSDEAKRALVDELWAAALAIDGGDSADEERALKAARDALAEALRSGAPAEEIERLTRELRAAMERYLAALARTDAARGRPEDGARPVESRDLGRVLDRIEKLGRTGSREAAEQLLSDLGEMLDGLRAAQPGQGGASQRALDALGDLMRRQRDLMDRTHRQGRDASGDARQGLADEQRGLREDLRRLGRALDRTGEGTGEGGDGEPQSGFGDADRAMGEAGDAIADDDRDDALDAQARALQGMRQSARELARRAGEQEGGAQPGRDGVGGEDPLGRPRNGREAGASRVRIPEEIDVERARRILEEIHRRLADPVRPRPERDYLDRLLRSD